MTTLQHIHNRCWVDEHSAAATARLHGITGAYVAMIRRGTSRADYVGNPFARLIR